MEWTGKTMGIIGLRGSWASHCEILGPSILEWKFERSE